MRHDNACMMRTDCIDCVLLEGPHPLGIASFILAKGQEDNILVRPVKFSLSGRPGHLGLNVQLAGCLSFGGFVTLCLPIPHPSTFFHVSDEEGTWLGKLLLFVSLGIVVPQMVIA